MARLIPPTVPPKLRELLKDYPGHIERLQEVLEEFAEPKLRLQPFDDALWALQDVLSGFIDEALSELEAAEAKGDAAEIAKADAKRDLMMFARSANGGMRVSSMDDLWGYFQTNKEAFE
jgi:hypothetical protein